MTTSNEEAFFIREIEDVEVADVIRAMGFMEIVIVIKGIVLLQSGGSWNGPSSHSRCCGLWKCAGRDCRVGERHDLPAGKFSRQQVRIK